MPDHDADSPRSPLHQQDKRRESAAAALLEAKADARERGDYPGSPGPGGSGGTASPSGGGSPEGRPPGKKLIDPQLFGAAIGGLLNQNGWQQQVAMGSVFGRWADIVGTDLAAHTRPDSFADGELAVIADSTAWATQVRLLAPVLVKRLNEELGDGAVRRVKVRGPQPPRRRGGWRVPGSKGPGDTYG
jgi:predicted nucleic acid-binding Zn ribbon protein